MFDRLKLLPRYLKTFGLVRGLSTFVSAEALETSVALRHVSSPVKLRKGTSDLEVFREVFLFETYGFDLVEPRVIVDAGANIGLTSVYFANRFRRATIFAVEPDASNFAQLLENTSAYERIIPVQAAFWGSDAKLRLKDKNAQLWARSVEECDASQSEFDGMSIKSFMLKNNIATIDLLKLDVEGSEKELFESACDWLQNTRCMIIEVHDWMKPGSSRAVMKTVSGREFSLRVVNSMLVFTNLNSK